MQAGPRGRLLRVARGGEVLPGRAWPSLRNSSCSTLRRATGASMTGGVEGVWVEGHTESALEKALGNDQIHSCRRAP
jgi:hypothetical protein